MELLSAFEQVFDTNLSDNIVQPLTSAVRQLNQYILNETTYTTIDAFLTGESVKVSESWAELSERVGNPISNSNIDPTI